MNTSAAQPIEKEKVATLKFPKEEVLKDANAIKERMHTLERGMTLGNLQKQKSRIYFKDNEGEKVVETTIWAVTSNFILLKYGVAIPVNRIIKISF
jgi:uncharacterized protein (UPF0248 family)